MYQTIYFEAFCNSFGETYKDNFSYDAKKAIFDYLEEYEESTGTPIELDPIAICCEWSEYEDWQAFIADYPKYERYDYDEGIEKLQDETTVLMLEQEGFVIIAF